MTSSIDVVTEDRVGLVAMVALQGTINPVIEIVASLK